MAQHIYPLSQPTSLPFKGLWNLGALLGNRTSIIFLQEDNMIDANLQLLVKTYRHPDLCQETENI